MKLSDAERGMLLSKMADDTVASIFGKSTGWVRRARAWLAANPAEKIITPVSRTPRAVRNSRHEPQGRAGAGDERSLSGFHDQDRGAISVAAPAVRSEQPVLADHRQGSIQAPKEPPAIEISPLDYPPWRGAFSIIKAPAPTEVAKFLGEPGQTFMGRAGPHPPAEPAKPAPGPAQRRRDPDPRLTKDLLRYVGWFHAAAWTWREISELFEIEAEVLRDALTPA